MENCLALVITQTNSEVACLAGLKYKFKFIYSNIGRSPKFSILVSGLLGNSCVEGCRCESIQTVAALVL